MSEATGRNCRLGNLAFGVWDPSNSDNRSAKGAYRSSAFARIGRRSSMPPYGRNEPIKCKPARAYPTEFFDGAAN